MTTEQNVTVKLLRRMGLASKWQRMAANSGDSDLAQYWNGYQDALLWARNTIHPERIRLEALEQFRKAKQ